MKKRKDNNSYLQSGSRGVSWINSLFSPTTGMAAELMNVSIDVIDEWLVQENLSLKGSDKLTDAAIDFLAHKYVTRLHKYFDNCVASWDSLPTEEIELFAQFKRKYGKFYHFWVTKWEDIDSKQIIRDFKEELKKKGLDAYLGEFHAFEFPTIIVEETQAIGAFPLFYLDGEVTHDSRVLLFSISHSLYYGSRIKTKVPDKPERREILLEILQENRFHIFTGESDGNGQIDVNFTFVSVNQPQLAIVPVFGYRRHKNKKSNEYIQKNTPYYCCPL